MDVSRRAFTQSECVVLATCDIRQPELALENTSCCRLLLADPSKVEYNLRHYFAQLHIGVIDTVHGMLTVFKRVIGRSLQSLHYRFVTWSKPDTTSLLLGTLTDLSRSKSELVAENALLRQQLLILRRQVNRPACTRRDRMLLVFLSRMARTWKQAHITRSATDEAREGRAKASSSTGTTSPEQHHLNRNSPQRRCP